MDQIPGPAVPSARAVLRPIGLRDARVTGGPLARWQRVNRETSIPLGLERMERSGALPNLRRAAGERDGQFQGYRFQDSDLYKQLEAVAWEHARAPDPRYTAFIERAAAVLAAAQRPDGYLNSHYQVVKPEKIYAELEYSHEMYCAGHLLQAAVAVARAGAGDTLLPVARRLADHLVQVFLTGGNDGIDGHAEVETALVELHRLTADPAYLDLAAKLVDNRGKGLIRDSGMGPLYAQDHLPVREADTPVGHAVRQLYLEAGVVDLYLETGDESLLECSVRRWEDMVATKTYVTGGNGSRHDGEAFGERYELPPDRAYSESCAAVASIHWNWRLLLATGHGRYADLLERVLFNAFAASTSADGRRFCYVNPLQRRNDLVEDAYLGRRREWFACACCPPNIMRLVASLGGYLATWSEAGLQLHQYAEGVVSGGGGRVRVDTDYPWDGLVRVTVEEAPAGEWELALRIPSWSETTYVDSHLAQPHEDGYFRIRRSGWRAGDTVELNLDLTPRLLRPHHRVDAVRGSAALQRGPLVYCFEQADQPGRVEVDDLAIARDAVPRPVPRDDLPGVGRTVLLDVDAVVVHEPRDGLPYTSKSLATSTRVTATAVPYFQWDNRDGGAMRVWIPLA
ncbi:glycoside hydrolase family 127 protein [Nonomuraea sp. NPDC050478]|uniref:glycoside hydrolase family 127 protein n=1 Tax=Nonomuraea sp. NPDC050478 TaxID=3364365 RepID=UPI0037A4E810